MDESRSSSTNAPSSLRIASLLPSLTDICISLGLADKIVAVTHECNVSLLQRRRHRGDVDGDVDGQQHQQQSSDFFVITKSGLNENLTQGQIDRMVKSAARGGGGTVSDAACQLNTNENDSNVNVDVDVDVGSLSLYPILESEFQKANPNIVLTQTLCQVCAPSPAVVRATIAACQRDRDRDRDPDNRQDEDIHIPIHSFAPETLMDVVETFVTVGEICNVPDRGREMKRSFMDKLHQIQSLCEKYSYRKEQEQKSKSRPKPNPPKVLLLEWMDPPYDGGHWIPDMIEWVGCEVCHVVDKGTTTHSIKSKEITWDGIYHADPDIVLVANCGFDLERNISDAKSCSALLRPLRAAKENKIFACNGDLNFARPGPELLGGVAVVAATVYGNDPKFMHDLNQLDFVREGLSMEWENVDVNANVNVNVEEHGKNSSCFSSLGRLNQHQQAGMGIGGIGDIEDIRIHTKLNDFTTLHQQACEAGELSYEDPATGYHVFTELAHKKRGKCCGTGCRHCPFHHVNVKDKAKRIMQPAFLYDGSENVDSALTRTCSTNHDHPSATATATETATFHFPMNLDDTKGKVVKVLFFSGGKDSFLSIRATIRSHREEKKNDNLCIILLTTFDSKSRIVGHQEIPITTIEKQARHLNMPLLGVPLHPGSSESYVEKLRASLDVIVQRIGRNVDALVFGDLHLETIRSWRDEALKNLGDCNGDENGIPLEYPLWQKPYDALYHDLEQSGVQVRVSASTVDYIHCNELYDRKLMDRARKNSADTFGENGEFHTCVEVWTTSRERALGLVSTD